MPDEPGEPVESPARIGPARLRRLLGRGAMGAVYEGELLADTPYGAGGSRVAVKVPSEKWLTEPGARSSFSREGRIGSTVLHPCIVRVLEHGETETGRPYIIQELVEGRTLRDLIRAHGALPEPFLRSVARHIADGLRALHGAGAVHRDIKPDNVGITPDHRIKLLDLGAAWLAADDGPGGRVGFTGSPVYASPEQFGAGRVDPRSDLYSLGATLYEAACGSPPFLGRTFDELATAHLEVLVVPLPRRAGRVSPYFAAMVEALLAKRPEDRFVSASRLAEVLADAEQSEWWRARRPAPGRRLPARLRLDGEEPLLGREREIARLESLLRGAQRGEGGALLLTGAPGIGKSSLVEALVRGAIVSEDGPRICWGDSEQEGARAPAGPVGRALCTLLGEPLEEALADRLSGERALVPALAVFLGGGEPAGGIEPVSESVALEVSARIARAECEASPVLWILEDLHEAGDAAHRLFLEIARTADGSKAAVIATSRPLPRGHPLLSAGVPVVTVEPLAPAAGLALARRAGGDGLPETTLAAITEKAAGVPLFLCELSRHARRRAVQSDLEGGGLAATRRREPLAEIPASLRELVLRRLEDMPTEDARVLQAAAVQGHLFDAELVAAALRRPALEIQARLIGLEEDPGIVRSAGGSFVFEHRLLADAICDGLEPPWRRKLHRRTGLAFLEAQGLAAGDPGSLPGEAALFAARHLVAGGRRKEALPVLMHALDHLERTHGSSRQVLELIRAGLGGLPGLTDAERGRLLLYKGRALHVLGIREEERDTLREALAHARSAGDDDLVTRSRMLEAEYRLSMDALPEAKRSCLEAHEAARRSGNRRMEGEALGTLGIIAQHAGDFEQAASWLERERRIAVQDGNTIGEAHAVTYLAVNALDQGLLEEALAMARRALQLRRAAGQRLGEAIALDHLGQVLCSLGKLDEARRRAKEALEIYPTVGYRRGDLTASICLAHICVWGGDLLQGKEWLERSWRHAREWGARDLEQFSACGLGRIALLEGDLESAEELARLALEGAEAVGNERVVVRARLLLAAGLEARGRLEEALEVCEAVAARVPRAGAIRTRAEICCLWGRLLLARGSVEALPLLEEAMEVSRMRTLPTLGALPGAWLARAGEIEPAEVEVDPRSPVASRAEAHAVLHLSGGGDEHRDAALRLLERLSVHLGTAERHRFWRNQPVARLLPIRRGDELDS